MTELIRRRLEAYLNHFLFRWFHDDDFAEAHKDDGVFGLDDFLDAEVRPLLPPDTDFSLEDVETDEEQPDEVLVILDHPAGSSFLKLDRWLREREPDMIAREVMDS
jgi:hypothetical protein